MTLLELTHQLSQTRVRAQRLLDTAHAEKRDLAIAEQIEFDSLITRGHEIEGAIEARIALRKA